MADRRWLGQVGRRDRYLIAASVAVAALTLWFSSAPFIGTGERLLLAILWPPLGVAWSVTLFQSVRRGWSRVAAGLLALGAGITFAGIIPTVATLVVGPWLPVMALAAALGLLGLVIILESPLRLARLVPPAIVLTTIGFAASGLPRLARFAMDEAALTAFATSIGPGETAIEAWEDAPVGVGSLQIEEAQHTDGCVFLGTTWVGPLGDVPAGLASCPVGPPQHRGVFEHLSGSWYRWTPY